LKRISTSHQKVSIERLIEGGGSGDDEEFDLIVFRLQDLIFSDEFEELETEFIDSVMEHFDDGETHTHHQYKAFMDFKKKVETHIDHELKEILPDYNLKRFQELAATRQDQIDEVIIETLTGLDEFDVFKQKVIERKIYKLSMEGKKEELLNCLSKKENIELVQNSDFKGLEGAITVSKVKDDH